MKLLPWPETTPGEFEGRTFEEALQLARQELGTEAVIRCWKVRRGGLFGFFAKETFVAGLNQPAGATARTKGARTARLRRGGQEKSTPEVSSPIFLYDLVEATKDEVTLGSDMALDRDFAKVLAQAEAVLISATQTDSVASAVPRSEQIPDEGERVKADLSKKPLSESQQLPDESDRVEGLRANLASLGVPSDYLPDESETLNALRRSLAKLPSAAPMSASSLIVVVGSRRDALAAAQQVAANLGLDASSLIVGEQTTSLRQRVMRRRSAKKTTVLVVEASLRSRDLAQVATWIDQLKPDYVLGAVPATAKRSDFEGWHAQIGRMDALALSRMTETMSLVELMGVLPIALLDGAPASTLRWVAALLNSMPEHEH